MRQERCQSAQGRPAGQRGQGPGSVGRARRAVLCRICARRPRLRAGWGHAAHGRPPRATEAPAVQNWTAARSAWAHSRQLAAVWILGHHHAKPKGNAGGDVCATQKKGYRRMGASSPLGVSFGLPRADPSAEEACPRPHALLALPWLQQVAGKRGGFCAPARSRNRATYRLTSELRRFLWVRRTESSLSLTGPPSSKALVMAGSSQSRWSSSSIRVLYGLSTPARETHIIKPQSQKRLKR